MSSVKENKEKVAEYLRLFEKSDVDSMLNMMTDDCTWWISGKKHLYPAAGYNTKEQTEAIFRNLDNNLVGGLQMPVTRMIGEGDWVAAEFESHGVGKKKNMPYDNTYCLLFHFLDNGKIDQIREYCDLMHVLEVFS